MTLYLGMHDGLIIVDPQRPQEAHTVLQGTRISAIEVDPKTPDRLFCATDGQGLLRSIDAGNTWAPAAIDNPRVLSVAISPADPSTVYAGTEPSHLYRSDDRGDTWREMTTLQDLPSKSRWSFPPRPDTHHVRWITPHPRQAGELLVAIEAGAIVRSVDGGETWQDRTPNSPIDSHTVRTHPEAPDLVRSAAGDGYFESADRGQTWTREGEGLEWGYCWGLAIDAAKPDLALISIAPNARQGHGGRGEPLSSIYRKQGEDPWIRVFEGLPDNEGTTLSVLAADPGASQSFYALNNRGLYASDDGGQNWTRLDVPWKDAYLERRPASLAVSPD